jgi:recombination protein RecR
MNRHYDRLIELFARLPGIGPRHAGRIVLSLLGRDPTDIQAFAQALGDLPTQVTLCKACFNVTDRDQCAICTDASRSVDALFVVERISDLQAVERAGLWKGRYHVLGGTIDPVGTDQGAVLRVRELAVRARELVARHGSVELVLATGTDTAGEATAQFLAKELASLKDVRLTRLGRGLSSGTHLEYADEMTLKHALESRK